MANKQSDSKLCVSCHEQAGDYVACKFCSNLRLCEGCAEENIGVDDAPYYWETCEVCQEHACGACTDAGRMLKFYDEPGPVFTRAGVDFNLECCCAACKPAEKKEDSKK